MGDAMAILDMEAGAGNSARQGKKKERQRRPAEPAFKRPEGMHRELYALLAGDSKEPPPIVLSDMVPGLGGMPGGYKQVKAKLGLKKVRPWGKIKFSPNPARKDGLFLEHWRRIADSGKEYVFAKFNKQFSTPKFTEEEYKLYIQPISDGWTRPETDHLLDLARRFDARFVVMHDRWDREKFSRSKSVEDMKERYYGIVNALSKARGDESKVKPFDAVHERKRKEQLIKLYNRTPEQVEEEEKLREEDKKIQQRKKEREKKTQDLQKLITAASDVGSSMSPNVGHHATPAARKQSVAQGDGHSSSQRNRSASRKRVSTSGGQRPSGSKESSATITANALQSAGIKFPEFKASGPFLRSQRLKLPTSVGQKRAKAIEQLLHELNIDLRPVPTEDIVTHFNDLRSDMVLLYELKSALANCEFELQTLKHQFDAVKPSSTGPSQPPTPVPELPPPATPLDVVKEPSPAPVDAPVTPASSSIQRTISEVIDVGAGGGGGNSQQRKKRMAAEQQQAMMKKIKRGM